jgi:hypothetical protein
MAFMLQNIRRTLEGGDDIVNILMVVSNVLAQTRMREIDDALCERITTIMNPSRNVTAAKLMGRYRYTIIDRVLNSRSGWCDGAKINIIGMIVFSMIRALGLPPFPMGCGRARDDSQAPALLQAWNNATIAQLVRMMTDGHHVGDEPGFARSSNGHRILLRYNKATDDWNGPVFQIRRGMISVNEMVTENAAQGTGAMGSQGTGVMGTGAMGSQGTGVMGSQGTVVPVLGVSVMAMDPEDQGDGDMDSDDDESTETTVYDENQGTGAMNVERD